MSDVIRSQRTDRRTSISNQVTHIYHQEFYNSSQSEVQRNTLNSVRSHRSVTPPPTYESIYGAPNSWEEIKFEFYASVTIVDHLLLCSSWKNPVSERGFIYVWKNGTSTFVEPKPVFSLRDHLQSVAASMLISLSSVQWWEKTFSSLLQVWCL